MDILWSPWRSQYIGTFKEEKKKNDEFCFFCDAITNYEASENNLTVKKWDCCFAILNKYPYNNGHLLVAPIRHTGDIESLSEEELIGLTYAVKESVKALKEVYKPHGFNIGINLGRAAGAGVPGHLHYHIVPRWNGDTNFMAITADVNVVSESLEHTKAALILEFEKLKQSNG